MERAWVLTRVLEGGEDDGERNSPRGLWKTAEFHEICDDFALATRSVWKPA